MNFRTPVVFLVGLALGMMVRTGVAQDQRLPGMNGVNHLAFATTRYDEMMTFYTRTLGFSEAFTNRNANGQPTLTYIQASRGTFVELMPAGANRPAGFTHFGLYVDDVKAVAARLGDRGVQVGEPRIIGSGSLTFAVTDPDGNRLEISELPPARPRAKPWKAGSSRGERPRIYNDATRAMRAIVSAHAGWRTHSTADSMSSKTPIRSQPATNAANRRAKTKLMSLDTTTARRPSVRVPITNRARFATMSNMRGLISPPTAWRASISSGRPSTRRRRSVRR